ncbi:hypothetical protein ACIBW9_34135 [Streptomyces sp. NPDC049541]|uniref:hypothetical protein n=1 Tax=Streptomyces sp. NPDC049541 TaxID=3365594 RepID=UPI0037B8092B
MYGQLESTSSARQSGQLVPRWLPLMISHSRWAQPSWDARALLQPEQEARLPDVRRGGPRWP